MQDVLRIPLSYQKWLDTEDGQQAILKMVKTQSVAHSTKFEINLFLRNEYEVYKSHIKINTREKNA